MNNQFSGRIETPQVIKELIADKKSNKLFVFGAKWCPDAMNLLQKLNMSLLPSYVNENLDKYLEWIEK